MFDREYFDGIWGENGVHRHDYCDGLSDRLIQKYGKVRFLDIGCSCGFLVKTLREKGCDAWGLEVSDYAISHSCDPEHVRKGDVRNIPWAADSFDVVHSQGLWGYFPKEDVQKAWTECKRVGKLQEHNIDYGLEQPSENQYLFNESKEWWDNQFIPKILVACSTNVVKGYSLQRWIDNVKKFTYPNFDILVVDTSETDEYIKPYMNQVAVERIPWYPQESRRMCEGMEAIRLKTLAGPYKYFFSVESDIIPPPDAMEVMLKWGDGSDWIAHAFPLRNEDQNVEVEQGIGCSLLSRKVLEENSWAGFDASPDGHFWNLVRPTHKYKTLEMWGYLSVGHLGS